MPDPFQPADPDTLTLCCRRRNGCPQISHSTGVFTLSDEPEGVEPVRLSARQAEMIAGLSPEQLAAMRAFVSERR